MRRLRVLAERDRGLRGSHGKSPSIRTRVITPSPSVARGTESKFDRKLDIEHLVDQDLLYDKDLCVRLGVDVDDLIGNVIKHDFDASMFDETKRRLLDFPRAPNIYKWLTDPRFCGSEGFKPWPKQIFVLASVFEEICPMPCCTDMRFFETMFENTLSLSDIEERVTFLEHGVCQKCGGNKSEFYRDGLVHLKEDVALCLGQRASKTSMAAGFAGSYTLHRELTLPADPARWYRLKPNQKLYGTFVAQTKDQAVMYPWADFINIYKSSAWFDDYNAALEDIAEEKGWDVGPVKIRETLIEYRHANLYVGCHGPNKRTLRGATRFMSGMDEFGWFSQDDTRETASAKETEDALANALLTLRSSTNRLVAAGWENPVNILNWRTSSPSHVGDPILTAVQRGRVIKKYFVLHAPTWEFNPEITRADLEPRFQADPEFAERSFGAVPPMAQSPFHKNTEGLVSTWSKGYSQLATTAIDVYTDKSGLRYVYAYAKNFTGDLTVPRVVSVDPGETNNSFAVVMEHLEPDGSLAVDVVISVSPLVSGDQTLRIHFPQLIEKLILVLCETYSVIAVVYDRWQSTHHVQQINDFEPFANRVAQVRKAYPHLVEGRGKEPIIGGAVKQTLRYSDFLNFDSRLADIQLPKLEKPFESLRLDLDEALRNAPVLNLVFQIITVRDTGAKVTKPARGDDDLYRAMVNGAIYMWHEHRMKVFTDHRGSLSSGNKGRRRSMLVVNRSGLGAQNNQRSASKTGVAIPLGSVSTPSQKR